jgi:8-oxo-dGTP diphosphatase
MPASEYIRTLRARVGHDLLFLPGVTAVVFNEAGHLLLVRLVDTGRWALIGGVMDPFEEPADSVIREVREEAGVTATVEKLIGVITQPKVVYPNQDEVTYVSIVFRLRAISGDPHPADGEAHEVRFFPLDALPPLDEYDTLRVQIALRDDAEYPGAFFLPPTWTPEQAE